MSGKQLPSRPSLEQYKKQAKDLVKAHQSGDSSAFQRIKEFHPRLGKLPDAEIRNAHFTLADAQFVIAREHGFESWTKFKQAIGDRSQTKPTPVVQLLQAISHGDVARVEAMLQEDKSLAKVWVYDGEAGGETLLHRHCSRWNVPVTEEHLQIARLLVRHGADVNALAWASNQRKATPLMVHAWLGQTGLVKLLLELGGDPNIPAEDGELPIDTAAVHRHSETVEALIVAGSRFDLGHVILAGLKERVVEILDRNPAEVNQHLPARNPRRDVPGLPLQVAIAGGEFKPEQREIFQLLLARGADVHAQDRTGQTPLARAIAVNNKEAAAELRGRGAKTDLYAAIGMHDADVVRNLIQSDPQLVHRRETDGITPLFEAARVGDLQTVHMLVEAGADVNVRAYRHWICLTPLHAAIKGKHDDVAKLLLKRSADPNACDTETDEWWPTPLFVAVRFGTRDAVNVLLDYGADLNGPYNPLTWPATHGNDIEMLRHLISRGADLRHPNHAGILHEAAKLGRTEIVKLLVEHGAPLNVRDRVGHTPLQCALATEKSETAEALRRLGARE